METEDGGRCRQLLIASIASLFVCNGTSVDRDDIMLNYKNIIGTGKFYLRGLLSPKKFFHINHKVLLSVHVQWQE